jgi:hypothetical protein
MVLSFFSLCGCHKGGESTTKDYDPISIKAMPEQTEYRIKDDINLKITYDFLNKKSKSVKIIIESDETIEIDGENEFCIDNVDSIKDKTINVKLKIINNIGEGEIRTLMYTYDDQNNQLYSRGSTFYYCIFDDSIVFSDRGIDELKRNHIDNLLRDGSISEEEHDEMLRELSREGVIEETIIIPGGGE